MSSSLDSKLSSDSLSLSGNTSPFSNSMGSGSEHKIFDLEKDFEELLDKLVIEDPVKRKQMLALPDASKKVLLEQQVTRTVKSKTVSAGSHSNPTSSLQGSNSFNLSNSTSSQHISELDHFDDVKSVIASLLNSKSISTDLVKSLRVHLNTADRDWLKSFLDLQGVKPLLDILSKVFVQIRKKKKRKELSILQFECLRCLASLMHIKIGMEYIASYPQAANLIILGLESPLLKVKTLALELLAAIAITDRGHPSVITAMIYYKEIKREDTRYSSLIKSLKSETNKEYLASCMSFINCIISSPSDLHSRMDIRKAFLNLKINKYIRELRLSHTEDKALITQLDVFEEELVTDEKLNIKEHENDVKINVEELFSQIYSRVYGTESQAELTSLIVHLQRMSSSQLGTKVWKLYNTLSSQLEMELSNNPEFDVSVVNLIFGNVPKEKKSLFSFGSKTKSPPSPSINGRGVNLMDNDKVRKDNEEKQKTIDHLLRQLNSYTGGQDIAKWQSEREEKNRIIQDLMKTQSHKNESPDLESYKTEIQSLKLEIERIKHNPISQSISGNSISVNNSNIATINTNTNVSEENTPIATTSNVSIDENNTSVDTNITTKTEDDIKPNEDNVDEVSTGGGPPPPPPPPPMGGGPGGPPPPPPPPGMKAKPSRPPKPVLKPSVKMRNFNWVTIPVPKIENTFWDKVDESAVISQLDKTELEYLFAAKALPPKADLTKSMSNKKVAITLIDMKKANNCAIMLQNFKLGNTELKRIQSQMDETMLTLENAVYLLQFVPSKEDIEVLKEYQGEVSNLGAAEQYMLHIMDIPKLEQKLRAHIFKLKFPTLLEELIPDIKAVKSASLEIKSSRKLSEILKYVLGIGNYINGSTNRGGAFGFKLETLAKMRDAKGNDGRMSVLHFLGKTIQDKQPDLFSYHSELSHLEHASEVSINNINSDTTEIKKGIELIEKEFIPLQQDPKYQGDKFLNTITEFLKHAKDEFNKMEKELLEMNKQYDVATSYFGDSKVTPPDQFFSVFNQFLEDLDKAHKENLSFIKKDSQEQKGGKYDDPEKGGFDDLTSHIRSGKFFQERRKSISGVNQNIIQQVQAAQSQNASGNSSGEGPQNPIPPTGFKLKAVNKQSPGIKQDPPVLTVTPIGQALLKPSSQRATTSTTSTTSNKN